VTIEVSIKKLYKARIEGEIKAYHFCVGAYLIPFLAKRPRRVSYEIIATSIGIKRKTDRATHKAIGDAIGALLNAGIIISIGDAKTRKLLSLPHEVGLLPAQSGFVSCTTLSDNSPSILTSEGVNPQIKQEKLIACDDTNSHDTSPANSKHSHSYSQSQTQAHSQSQDIVGLTPDATFDLDIVSKVCKRIEKHVKNICNGKTPALDAGILAGKPTAPARMLLSRIAEVRKGVPKFPDLTPEDVETYFLDLIDNLAESKWWVQQTTGGKSNLNLATIFGPKKWANKYSLVLLESGWIPPSRRKPEEIKLGF